MWREQPDRAKVEGCLRQREQHVGMLRVRDGIIEGSASNSAEMKQGSFV